ncbi:MAG: NADH-quinone oxidoreductase subunit N [Chloroflexota bacterium]|nr:NADH-quinone oxidoreductase subunit N [Chloroflexota bacterium]
MTLSQILALLAPELILAITGLVVLVLDMVWRDEKKKEWLLYVTLVGLVGTLAAIVTLWHQAAVLFSGIYTVDMFALLFKLIAIVGTGLVVLSAIEFMRGRTPYPCEFYSLLLFATLGISLIASATDLILIYLAIELLSITSYILTGYLRQDPKSNEAAIKYFLYGAVASAVMLYGMSLLYGATGSTNLNQIAMALGPANASLQEIIFPAVIFLLVGFGFKIGAVPFHQWAPDAYEGAPTPVTAFLSVGPKAAGFAVLVRVFLVALPSFQPDWILLLSVISVVTMTLGNLVAIWQKNIKRMLAYSSIAQAGYILLGMVATSTLGITSLVFYMFTYLFANLGAFIIIIAFSNGGGGDSVEDYAGLSQRSPGLALAMLLCLLSLAGIPPLAGFIGKFYLFAAIMKDGLIWLMLIGVLNSVISLYYYLEVVRQMYIIPPKAEEPVSSTSKALSGALLITMIGVLLLGLYPAPLIELIRVAACAFLSG